MTEKRDEEKDSGVTDSQPKSDTVNNGSESKAGADADQCEGVPADNTALAKSKSKKSKKQGKSDSANPAQADTPECAEGENAPADATTAGAGAESPLASTTPEPATLESSASKQASAALESPAAADAFAASTESSVDPLVDTKAEGPVSETADSTITGEAHAHAHGAKMYGEVLERSIPVLEGRTYHHPLFIDALLAAGLLVAVGGITLGLVKLYITQEAKADISQRRYSQAITVLQGAPLPGWFSMQTGQDDSPEELLNQAYWLDSMEKLDANKNDTSAIKQLEKIHPGSRFYKMANEMLDVSAPRSAITLQGNVEHPADASEANSPEAKPLVPENE